MFKSLHDNSINDQGFGTAGDLWHLCIGAGSGGGLRSKNGCLFFNLKGINIKFKKPEVYHIKNY